MADADVKECKRMEQKKTPHTEGNGGGAGEMGTASLYDAVALLRAVRSDGEGFTEVRAKHPDGYVSQAWHADPADAAADALTMTGKADVWFGVAPRFRRAGSKADVREVQAVYADLDGHGLALADLLARTDRFPLPFSALVATGHGLHGYLFLREPWPLVTDADRHRFEAVLKGLVAALGADPAAAELARVLRVPGTLNLKPPRVPDPVRLLRLDEGVRYALTDIEEALPAVLPSQRLGHEPGWVVDALADMAEGNRNTNLFAIAGRLRRGGFTPGEIAALLQPHAERCGLPLAELVQLATSAGRYPVVVQNGPALPVSGAMARMAVRR